MYYNVLKLCVTLMGMLASDDDFQCVLKLMSAEICRKHCCVVIHTPDTINALFTLSVTRKMMLNK